MAARKIKTLKSHTMIFEGGVVIEKGYTHREHRAAKNRRPDKRFGTAKKYMRKKLLEELREEDFEDADMV